MYKELNGCVIGEFSKLKLLQAPKFDEMRKMFAAELMRMFFVPANTFDNVKGEFPIGFKVWRTDRVRQGAAVPSRSPRLALASEPAVTAPVAEDMSTGEATAKRPLGSCDGTVGAWPYADVYDRDGRYNGTKGVHLYDGEKVINDWVGTFGNNGASADSMGTLLAVACDFQHRNTVNICEPNKPWNHQFQWQVMPSNVLQSSIYFAVRLCIEATWLNDRDQFLYPNDGWKTDGEFQDDCLVFALFHGQNRISCEHGVNQWIPFTEEEVGAQDCFASHFMRRSWG